MAIPADYFDQGPGGTPSQASRDVANGRAIALEFARIVNDVTRTFADGGGVTSAQKTALRTYYATWRTRAQAWFNSLPTP